MAGKGYSHAISCFFADKQFVDGIDDVPETLDIAFIFRIDGLHKLDQLNHELQPQRLRFLWLENLFLDLSEGWDIVCDNLTNEFYFLFDVILLFVSIIFIDDHFLLILSILLMHMQVISDIIKDISNGVNTYGLFEVLIIMLILFVIDLAD